MLKDIHAFIFDLDGTLVDSMWIWKEIDEVYLDKYQITVPDGFQDKIEGFSFTETAHYFKEFFSLKDSIETIKNDWNELAWEYYTKKVPMKKNVHSVLTYAKNNNIKLGIASSNSRELVEAVLESLHISHFFDVVVTSCEAKIGKPAPDVYLLAAKLLDIPVENCLVFEDVIAGIQAGKNANMKVCAVEDDFSSHKRNEKMQLADYFIYDYSEVLTNYQK